MLRCKEKAGEPYQPSNGTEGDFFQARFCDRCRHDRAWREAWANDEEPGAEDGCDILARSYAFDPGHEMYPVEWIYDEDGEPTCTAFELDAGEDHHYKCPDPTHPDLFAEVG